MEAVPRQPSPVASLDEVRARLRAALPDLRARYGLTSLAVFGSFARGEQTATSDVDLLVEYRGVLGLFDLGGLVVDLEDLLGRPVEIADPSRLRPEFRPGILEDAVAV